MVTSSTWSRRLDPMNPTTLHAAEPDMPTSGADPLRLDRGKDGISRCT